MRVGKPSNKSKQPKTPTLNPNIKSNIIITHSLRTYSHQNLAWLRTIDKIMQKPRSVLSEINYNASAEWMQRYFRSHQSSKEITQLVQYYKYYKTSPLLVNQYHFAFMNGYWSRSKTIYYLRIKKILQIEHEGPDSTFQRNIEQEQSSKTEENKSTFYLMPQLIGGQVTPVNQNNSTLEKIISSLQKKGTATKAKTITDIDKAFKLSQKDQSKTKDRHSQQKSHLKSNPSNFVSHFSYKNTVTKKKKNNHKSLSSQPVQSQEKISKGKKLITTNSCMNIAYHQNNLNYQRREKEKNPKHSQKQIKTKKREGSQINLHEPKSTHKKAKSNEKSAQAIHKSKSNKKRIDTQTNVRAAIDKTKHKIKMQKNLMLKKYIQSRQSITKSIDSTCGDAKHARK